MGTCDDFRGVGWPEETATGPLDVDMKLQLRLLGDDSPAKSAPEGATLEPRS